jgi:hypothetical protein
MQMKNEHLAIYVVILNCADAYLTHRFVCAGVAEELNPLTRWLLCLGPEYFFFVKIFAGTFGVLFLYHHRRRRLADFALKICAVTYSAIIFLHAMGTILQKA